MQDNNENETNPVSNQESSPVETTPEMTSMTSTEAVNVEKTEVPTTTMSPLKKNLRLYLLTGLAVLIMAAGLTFVLEKEGRISTGLFGSMVNDDPVAIVNDTKISRSDFESSLNQLIQMAASQGASTTDAALIEGYRTQAIETLVNGELLRQSAIAEGMEATQDAIDARYKEIEDGIGGADALASRMAEFGITEKILRRDIQNEILIQGLFDSKFSFADSEVTDEEINKLYSDLGGVDAGLPPLKDVRDQVISQIRQNRQQEAVSKYIDELRAKSDIQVLI